MRKYAPLYNSSSNTWSVIFQDDFEIEWYVQSPDAGSEETTKLLAEALNERERQNNG